MRQIVADIDAGKITRTRQLMTCFDSLPGDLESMIDRFQHGECHAWTAALIAQMPDLTPVVILDGEEMDVLHSMVALPGRDLLLDAGGVWTLEDALDYWSGITRCPCISESTDLAEILAISGASDEDIEDAQAHFELWASLSRAALSDADDQPGPP